MVPAAEKICVITGTSSGIGAACVAYFLELGWRVIGVDLMASTEPHTDYLHLRCDISDEPALAKALGTALDGRTIDAVINAAGIFPPSNLDDFSEDLYRRIFDVNVLGSLSLCRLGARHMNPQGGAICLFASVDAFAVSCNQLLYSASKAAVVSIVKSLSTELAARKITINAVAPGWVKTKTTLAGGRLEHAVQSVPLKRAAQPEEIAEWVFALTHKTGYLTGETLCISGGIIVR